MGLRRLLWRTVVADDEVQAGELDERRVVRSLVAEVVVVAEDRDEVVVVEDGNEVVVVEDGNEVVVPGKDRRRGLEEVLEDEVRVSE